MSDGMSDAITDQQVLKDIIKRLENGVLPWRRPWSDRTGDVVIGSMPHSANTWPSNLRAPKVPYGVFNGTILLAHASNCGYRTNLWVPDHVVEELGAAIDQKDASPAALQRLPNEYVDYRDRTSHARLVYNIDQVRDCEKMLGLSFLERKSTSRAMRFTQSIRLQRQLESDRGLQIRYASNQAAYYPSWDVVTMPAIEQFTHMAQRDGGDGEANYWATLWHEVIHWTGHGSRLDRAKHRVWGDDRYAFEELIAELGAAFLCAHLGINGDMQHPSYIDSWCRALQKDKIELLWNASVLASKAKDFVLKREKTASDTGLFGS